LEYHLRFSAAIDRYLDEGMGSCLLRQPQHARIVSDAFHFFDGQRYELWSYVVMPNHVHVVFTVGNGERMSDILQS
jgi:type I restriction enzyme R subunit